MRILKQGTTPTVVFLLVLASDGKTGATGLAVTVKLAKYGGSGSMTSGTTATNSATQIDAVNLPGWYQITLTAVETNTIGDLIIRATATGADQTDRLCVVESADITDMDGEIDAVLTALSAIPTAPLLSSDTRLGNLDAAISSRLPTEGYTGITTAQIDTALTAAHGSGLWQSGGGGGSTGSGITPVNHDTGGVDALRYLAPDLSPVDGGGITAFLKSSYDAGNYSTPLGSTETRSDGRWKAPLMLDAGVVYTIVFYKQGVLQITTVAVTP